MANVGKKKLWQQRLEFIQALESKDHLLICDDSSFPFDGSHYRAGQIDTIWRIFGIKRPILPNPSMRTRIEELVENRNAIAHGRRTADDVGRAYSVADMNSRIDDVENITSYLLQECSNFYSSGGLLRNS